MEFGSGICEKPIRLFAQSWGWFKSLLAEKLRAKVVQAARNTKKVGQDDPRRIIHSLKVGFALTLVSLIYYFHPLYSSFGVSAMTAVITVVVVFEFSVGATLGRGLNRGFATLLAGALGVGAHQLASMSGKIGKPVLIELFIFLQAAASTFIRFFPGVKARYDYGMLMFIMTFCLVSATGLQNDEILELAHKRLWTVLIGALVCVIVSVFVCPVWAGEELHNLIAFNMEKLANFLEGFEEEYFRTVENEEVKDEVSILQAYRSVLNSKSSEETLANFARWEPGHGRFMYRHPWKQYLKVGALTRQCAYKIEALNSGNLNSTIQVLPEIRENFWESCKEIRLESGKALKDLALAIKTLTQPSSADTHIANSKTAVENLQSLLKSSLWGKSNLLEVIPLATVVSLLMDVVICTEKIADSVHELAFLAHFKSVDPNGVPKKSHADQCASLELANKNDGEGRENLSTAYNSTVEAVH